MPGIAHKRQPRRAGRRVLIVEDDLSVRELIARHFRRAGDDVVAAGSAEEVELAGHRSRRWDVVVADVHLPGMSGIELLRALPHRGSAVLMTGDPSGELALEAQRGPSAGYLLKPFELFELDALLRLAGGSEARPIAKPADDAELAKPVRAQVVPLRAMMLSLAALLVPLVAPLATPRMAAVEAVPYELLLWVTALIPPFLLAYYRGWRGAASALALGMATLALGQLGTNLLGLQAPSPEQLLPMVLAYLMTCLGAGWLAGRLHVQRLRAEHNALTDVLTGLANRAHLEDFMRRRFAAAIRGQQSMAVLFIDLDHFKRLNDELGHQAGDEALAAFGGVLRRTTRADDMAARYGGEEFVCVLNAGDLDAAKQCAERIRQALAATTICGRHITASIGIALLDAGMREPHDLITAADAATYAAKRAGRDRVCVYDGAVVVAREVELRITA